MPAIRHKKKKETAASPSDKIVSAYTEEGQTRIAASERKENRVRIVTLIIVIVMLLATIAGTITILHFTVNG